MDDTKKIAILGAESSHARHFLSYVRDIPEFSDIRVVGIYSDDEISAEKLAQEFDAYVMKSHKELVGELDGIVITARDANSHYSLAEPYIKNGIPMLIDKPITQSNEDAVALAVALQSADIKVVGGSALKYDGDVQDLKRELQASKSIFGGVVRAPLMSDSPYGGFFFYAPHLIEMVCELFGRYPKSVMATGEGENTEVLFKYDGFECVGIYTERGKRYYAEIRTESGDKSREIYPDEKKDLLFKQFLDFHTVLLGGKPPHTYAELFAPVFIANAIKRSLETAREQKIYYFG